MPLPVPDDGAGGRRRRARARDRAARGARRPVIMAGTRPVLGPRGAGAARARRGAADPGLPQRPGARLRPRRPRAVLLPRAVGRRCRAPTSRSSSACRWTSGSASAARSARTRRSSSSTARSRRGRIRGRWRRSCTARERRRSTCCGRRCRRRHGAGVGRVAARRRGRGACGRARAAADERAPLHPMRIYGELGRLLDRDAIVIGDGGDFVSYAGRMIDSYEPGCWLDPGPFGCLGSGPGYALAAKLAHPRAPGRAAAGRRRVRLCGHGVRHARAPRRGGRRRDGQQRHLGAGEAPDGAHLRLLGGGRAARRRRATTRSSRRWAATASSCARRPSCGRRWSARSRPGVPALVNVLTDPVGGLPAALEPRLSSGGARRALKGGSRPQGKGRLPDDGPDRTGRGTCLAGPYEVVRAAGGADPKTRLARTYIRRWFPELWAGSLCRHRQYRPSA